MRYLLNGKIQIYIRQPLYVTFSGLSACNAVCLLAQARLFEENTLLQQCFEMIDKNSDIALQVIFE